MQERGLKRGLKTALYIHRLDARSKDRALHSSAPDSDGLRRQIFVGLGKCDGGSAKWTAWPEACPDRRIRRIVQIGVLEVGEHPRNIHPLARQACHPFAERAHSVAENFLEFFDFSIGLIHYPILRLIGQFR